MSEREQQQTQTPNINARLVSVESPLDPAKPELANLCTKCAKPNTTKVNLIAFFKQTGY